MKLQEGVTMIELMIVVAIIGILAAVGFPAYGNYVLKGKIPDATSFLATKRVQMEQFFQDNRTYAGSTAAGQACASDSASSQYFTFSCTAPAVPDATTYTITATGITEKGTGGFSYTINQSNVKTSTIAAPAPADWIATSTTCWITKQGGVC